jgi:hypothetical protein
MRFLFAVLLVLAGLVPVLYLAALFAWQIVMLFQAGSWVPLPATLLFMDHASLQAGKAAPVLAFIPEFPWAVPRALAWVLDRLHLALLFALIGLALMGHGTLAVLRQTAAIRLARQRDEDRQRRRRDYEREDGRREPFIG